MSPADPEHSVEEVRKDPQLSWGQLCVIPPREQPSPLPSVAFQSTRKGKSNFASIGGLAALSLPSGLPYTPTAGMVFSSQWPLGFLPSPPPSMFLLLNL